ncbi:MAG: cysteine synthase family protein [Candidatus Nealsonbacteria bacterium]|nr:cysteine synthase family protein [Candidatus Nealsonbacteria bacterium]
MNNVLKYIGKTPMVEIESGNPKVKIFAKLEGFNPTGSTKDRIALAMVEKAERAGVLTKGKTIIEPTSGNTGIALAMVAAVKGYKIKIVMPESMSIERRKMIKAFGAELILVKPEEWRDAAIKMTKALVEKDKNLVMLNQFENQENCQAHYRTTGKEILEQVKGKIDYFVGGIGTGGTITGIGKRIKEKFPKAVVIGVQPILGCKIEGLKSIKEGYVPPVLEPSLPCGNHAKSLIDAIVEVSDIDSFEMTRELAKKSGLLVGASSGALFFVARSIAKKMKKGTIVTIFPDRGEKYLSTAVFE